MAPAVRTGTSGVFSFGGAPRPSKSARRREPGRATPGNRLFFLNKRGTDIMLVLSRSRGEQIVIGDSITLTVLEIRGDKVRLGFAGSAEVPIHRQEVYERLKIERQLENVDAIGLAATAG
jgi:carbon storage regulator